jgi:23S rRNA (uracil1939-C5)-methyltransferase
MTFGRSAIARVDGKVVILPAAVPGDLLEIELVADKRDYATGRIVRLLEPAPARRQPPCRYASKCGGCDWQQIDYESQLRLKAELIAAEFRHTLGMELDRQSLVERAPAQFGYRSRVRLKTGRDGAVGFYEPDTNSLVAVEECLVAGPAISAAAALARLLDRKCSEIEVVEATPADAMASIAIVPDGAPSEMRSASGGAAGSAMHPVRKVVLVAHLSKPPGPLETQAAQRILSDDIAGVILRSAGTRRTFGSVSVAVEVEPGCTIEAAADLFSQVNRAQNRKLVAAVMESAQVSAVTRLLDLFCGSGNFSFPAARRGGHVTGVDDNALAIAAARANAARLNLNDAQFIAMSAVEAIGFLAQAGYRPDVVIVDPPRSGAADLIQPLVKLRPRVLIYVSCHPPSLVRDLPPLKAAGYTVTQVRAFDFFPNTHHVEIAASLLLT